MDYKIDSVTASGIDIDYLKFGCGEKALVIIPGLAIKSVIDSASAVVAAYKPFCDDYTVYLFDRNKTIKNGCTIFDFANDLAFALRLLDIKNADFFGVSQGGMIAQCIAINFPDLVHKMVLGSTLSRLNKTAESTINNWIKLAKSSDENALAKDFMHKLFSADFCEKFGDFIISANSNLTQEELNRFIKLAGATSGFDIYENLDKIKCPTLVIGTEGDSVVTGQASYEIAEKIPNCEIYMYGSSYGHGVYDEAPDYKDRILKFLQK